MAVIMIDEPCIVPAVGREFAGARLGDARRTRRLVQAAGACASRPESSLPKALASKGALNATYALFSHSAVNDAAILAPHQAETRERCMRETTVLVAHDTTEFAFSTHRDGLGHLRSVKDHGFLMHGSLAITADGNRRPLGVVGAYFWTRTLETENAEIEPRESERWLQQCIAAEGQLGSDVSSVHIMDREGDSYELLARLQARSSRFIVRNRIDRIARLDDEGPTAHIQTLGLLADIAVEISVAVSRRALKKVPQRGTSQLPREARVAKLAVKAVAVQIRKPPYLRELPMWLDLNIVYVKELDAPEGVEPIDWTLYTTEPIASPEDALSVVERYRSRWLIEEWFKAIKTGCEVEKLQLETYAALKNTIAMYLVIAWRMLLIRTLARNDPQTSAEAALSLSELHVLRVMQPDAKLPRQPTIAQAFLAVAMMGGYIKHKIPPGWLTLARGLEKLILLERGFSLAGTSPINVGDP